MKNILKNMSVWKWIVPCVMLLGMPSCNDDENTGLVPPEPVIEDFNPKSGLAGTTITITGSNLLSTRKVQIGDVVLLQMEKADDFEGIVTDTEIKVTTTEELKVGGKIKITTQFYEIESEEEFEVTFHRPSVTSEVPSEAKFNTQLVFTGENLDLVEKVLFGTVEGTIGDRSSTELQVTVPYVESDEPMKLAFTYQYGEEDAELVLSEAFKVLKVRPENLQIPSKSVVAGETFTITGTNLDVITSVKLFTSAESTTGTELTTSLSQDGTQLTCTVPSDMAAISAAGVIKYYYQLDTEKEEILCSDFTVTRAAPTNLAFKDSQSSVKAGETFTITGDYLSIVERVELFSDASASEGLEVEHELVNGELVCTVPISATAMESGVVKVFYTDENTEKSVQVTGTIKVEEIYNIIFENIVLTTTQYFDVMTGEFYDKDYIDDNPDFRKDKLLLILESRWKEVNNNGTWIQITNKYNAGDDTERIPMRFRRVGYDKNETPTADYESGVFAFLDGTATNNVNNTIIPDNAEEMKSVMDYDGTKTTTVIRRKVEWDSFEENTLYNQGKSGNGWFEATSIGGVSCLYIHKPGESGIVYGYGFIKLVSTNETSIDNTTSAGISQTTWKVNTYFPKNMLDSYKEEVLGE